MNLSTRFDLPNVRGCRSGIVRGIDLPLVAVSSGTKVGLVVSARVPGGCLGTFCLLVVFAARRSILSTIVSGSSLSICSILPRTVNVSGWFLINGPPYMTYNTNDVMIAAIHRNDFRPLCPVITRHKAPQNDAEHPNANSNPT